MDIWAIIRTAAWDSPLAKAMEPENWAWYGPMSAVHIETRDLLRIIATKQYPHPKVRKQQIPPLTVPPWRTDANRSRFAPEPVTKDEIDAHLMRINGRTPDHRAHVEPTPTPAPQFRDVDVEQMRVMLADGLTVERVASFFGASPEFVGEIARISSE